MSQANAQLSIPRCNRVRTEETAIQFHLNGFRTGDPEISESTRGTVVPSGGLPETLDVLIIGCRPTGLTLAAKLAARVTPATSTAAGRVRE